MNNASPNLDAANPTDARLIVLAREIRGFDVSVVTHQDANPIETEASDARLMALLKDCEAQEREMARTPASSLVGVLAKAEICRGDGDTPNEAIVASLIEDIIRLIPPHASPSLLAA